jgi:hypothetical protein
MTWSDTGGKEFEQPPAGPTVGRCVRIIDLGTQDESYQGKAKKVRQVMVGWELPNLPMEDGRPFLLSKIYTMSLNERANLRSDLENWRGKDLTDEEAANFDEKVLLGKVCLLNVKHTDKKKAKVDSIMPVPRDADGKPTLPVPKQVNESIYVSLEAAVFDREASTSSPTGRRRRSRSRPSGRRSARPRPSPTPEPSDRRRLDPVLTMAVTLTNKHGLPEAIVRAVMNDPYDRGNCDFTVTQLLQPPQLARLTRENDIVGGRERPHLGPSRPGGAQHPRARGSRRDRRARRKAQVHERRGR